MNSIASGNENVSKIYEHWFSKYSGELVSNDDPQLVHIKANLPLDKSTSILDAGCGSGRYARSLLALGYHDVHCIDVLEPTIGMTPPNYKKASLDCLPFNDQAFDLIYANSVIYHVKDQIHALQEIRRVLRPEGRLLISGHASTSAATTMRRLKLALGFSSVRHLAGAKFHSPLFYQKMLMELGFEDVRMDGFARPWPIGRIYRGIARRLAKAAKLELSRRRYVPSKSPAMGVIKAFFLYHFVISARLPTTRAP